MKRLLLWLILLSIPPSLAASVTVSTLERDLSAPLVSVQAIQEDKKIISATFQLMVQNNSALAVQVAMEFSPSQGPRPRGIEYSANNCVKRATFWTTAPKPLIVTANGSLLVPVTYCAPDDASLEAWSGQVQVRAPLPFGPVYAHELTVKPPSKSLALTDADQVGFGQNDLVLDVTCNPFSACASNEGSIVWGGTTDLTAIGRIDTPLYNTAGTPATLTFEGDQTAARLAVHNVQAGTYSGDFLLRPGDVNSPSLKVTANVRHHWIWPLLALVVTSGLLWSLLVYRDYTRPRAELKGVLAQAVQDYKKDNDELASKGQVQPIFDYDDDVKKKGSHGKIPLRLALFRRIDLATTPVELTAVTADIEAFAERLRRWLPFQQQVATFESERATAVAALNSYPELLKAADGTPLAVETAYPVTQTITLPMTWDRNSAKDLDVLQQAIESRFSSLWLFKQGLIVYGQCLKSGAKQGDAETNFRTLSSTDPLVLQSGVDTLRLQLLASMTPGVAAFKAFPTTSVPALIRALTVTPSLLPSASAIPISKSSTAIKRLISANDRLVFSVLLVFALTAVFIAQYAGKNFGSVWDYLALITSGATGVALFKGLDLLPAWQLGRK